ncbi:unnamed protein product [Hapterophycus canaliculatus]
MCICKGSSSSSLKSKTTNRIVNKSMPPPGSPPNRAAPRRTATTTSKGVRPPPPPGAAAATTTTTTSTTTDDDNSRSSSGGGGGGGGNGTPKTALSFDQLSSVLDPFFVDTCNFLKQSPWAPKQDSLSAAETVAPIHADSSDGRLEAAYLSPWGEATGDALDCAQQQKADLSSGNGSGGALQDFLSSGNSAWMETVQDMEAEKKDMLRLDVRVAFC